MVSEAACPGDALDLVIELRGTETSRSTADDTPTCTRLGWGLWSLDGSLVGLG